MLFLLLLLLGTELEEETPKAGPGGGIGLVAQS